MQSSPTLLLVAALVGAGYFSYPSLKTHLISQDYKKDKRVGQASVQSTIEAPKTKSIDLTQVAEHEFPSVIELIVDLDLKGLFSENTTTRLKKGQQLKPLELKEDKLVVSLPDNDSVNLLVKVADTDFVDQVMTLRRSHGLKDDQVIPRMQDQKPEGGTEFGVPKKEESTEGDDESSTASENKQENATNLLGANAAIVLAKKAVEEAHLADLSVEEIKQFRYLGKLQKGSEDFEVVALDVEKPTLLGNQNMEVQVWIKEGKSHKIVWASSGFELR